MPVIAGFSTRVYFKQANNVQPITASNRCAKPTAAHAGSKISSYIIPFLPKKNMRKNNNPWHRFLARAHLRTTLMTPAVTERARFDFPHCSGEEWERANTAARRVPKRRGARDDAASPQGSEPFDWRLVRSGTLLPREGARTALSLITPSRLITNLNYDSCEGIYGRPARQPLFRRRFASVRSERPPLASAHLYFMPTRPSDRCRPKSFHLGISALCAKYCE